MLAAERILIVLHGSIGDVVRAIPLVNAVRKAYPHAHIGWSVEPPAAPLVETLTSVNEVILFERSSWWRSARPFLRRIREGHYDLVLDLQRHLKSGIISRWSGAMTRIGFHRKDAKEFNWGFNNCFIPYAGNGISKLDHYLKFAEALGIDPYPLEWKIQIKPEELARVRERLQSVPPRFAVFFVGSKWESKQWFPLETAKAAADVQRRFSLGVVLLGGSDAVVFARDIERTGLGKISNWVGQTSLRESAAVLSSATVAIGPDSGLMHLASAVGTPVVSLWGATDPQRTGPYGFMDLVIRGRADCSPCYLHQCPIGRICMQTISTDQVTRRVERALDRKGDSSEFERAI